MKPTADAVAEPEPQPIEQPKAETKTDTEQSQLSFFGEEKEQQVKEASLLKREKQILAELKQLDLLEMTPLDAMNAMYKL